VVVLDRGIPGTHGDDVCKVLVTEGSSSRVLMLTAAGAVVPGDARLIYRLASNLADNAVRYNTADGRVGVTLTASTTEAALTVTNTGPLYRQTRSADCSNPSSALPRTGPPARTGTASACPSSQTSPRRTEPASRSIRSPAAA
jgi:hypothetical protein